MSFLLIIAIVIGAALIGLILYGVFCDWRRSRNVRIVDRAEAVNYLEALKPIGGLAKQYPRGPGFGEDE